MTDASSFSAALRDAQPVGPSQGDAPTQTDMASATLAGATTTGGSDPREAIIEHLPRSGPLR